MNIIFDNDYQVDGPERTKATTSLSLVEKAAKRNCNCDPLPIMKTYTETTKKK